MNGRPDRPLAGGVIAGAILIVLGIVFALDSMGILYAGDLLSWWPLILIGIGLGRMFQTHSRDQRIGYAILIVIGAFFLMRNLHVPGLRGRDLLPLLFLLIGALLVWQGMTRHRIRVRGGPAEESLAAARERLAELPGRSSPGSVSPGTGAPAEGIAPTGAAWTAGPAAGSVSVLQEFAFMGGGDRVVRAQDFRGGEVTAIMGGFHIDLRGANIAGDSATIEIFTLWGGVDLRVPESWNVVVQGTPILGVFTTTGRPVSAAPATKTLVLKGTAIMGGVEVKY